MRTGVCVCLLIAFAATGGRVVAEPVTSYPSIASFEAGALPWVNDLTDTADWYTWYRDYYYTPIGPYDGNYFAGVYSWDYGLTAIMMASFDLSSLTEPTISFAFHLYSLTSSSPGSLFLEASLDGSTWSQLWGDAGNHGNSWYTMTIALDDYVGETNLMLRFRAVIGYNYNADIGLDYIVVQGTQVGSDTDGDGMPNDWEELYFSGPTNAIPTDNPDLDHYNNLEEYIAGLNPKVYDGLWLTGFSVDGNNVFHWTPASGRVYSVYWTDNLLNGYSLMQGNLTSGSYTDTLHSASDSGYYKLKVEVAP